MRKTSETLADRIARRVAYLLPRRVCYWVYIRVGAEVTSGDRPLAHKHVPDVGMMEALQAYSLAGKP